MTKSISGQMTVQELCDKLTILCHEGYAQAMVVHVSKGDVIGVADVEMIGDEWALIRSIEV